jgi:hypothetical protein
MGLENSYLPGGYLDPWIRWAIQKSATSQNMDAMKLTGNWFPCLLKSG